jgi:hypothetical protein
MGSNIILTWPDQPGDKHQLLHTDGSNSLTFDWADRVIVDARNASGVTINAGDPVYVTGYNSGVERVEIGKADASDPTKMSAIGVATTQINNNSNGEVILNGFLEGVDTSLLPVNTKLYVAAGGGFTSTKPTGTNLIQNIAIVFESDANGTIAVLSPGRTNDVPNLPQDYLWIGDASGVATPTPLSTISTSIDHSSLSTLAWDSSGHTGTISTVAAFDGLGDPTFLSIGTDIQAWSADLDTYAANPLTSAELNQLQAIDTVTISNTQWGYLGALASAPVEDNDIGVTVQAYDADLAAIAALATTGILVRTAADTWATRSIDSGDGISVSNVDGVAGNPSVAVTADVLRDADVGSQVQAWSSDLDTYASNPLTAVELQQLQNIDATTISTTQWGYLGALASDPLEDNDIGVTVQAYDADLTTIAGLSNADGNFIVGNGSAWVVESGNTARTSLGLGTGDTPTFTSLTLTDTDTGLVFDGVSSYSHRLVGDHWILGSSTAGNWFRIATITIGSRFQQGAFVGHIKTNTGAANAAQYLCRFQIRVQQQAALGSSPNTSFYVERYNNPAGDIRADIVQNDATATVVEIYSYVTYNFSTIDITGFYIGNATLALEPSVPTATTPSGTQILETGSITFTDVFTDNITAEGVVSATSYVHGLSGGAGGEAFRIGNDASLHDISLADTIGIRGIADDTRAQLRTGSSGIYLMGNEVGLHIGPTAGVEAATSRLEVDGVIDGQSASTGTTVLRARGDEMIWYDGTTVSWGSGGSRNVFADSMSVGTTTAPGYTLDVNGDGAFDTNVTIDDGTSAVPSFTSYSNGTRLILFDNISASSSGYTQGIGSSRMWFTTDTSANTKGFDFYGGTTAGAKLLMAGGGLLMREAASPGTAETAFGNYWVSNSDPNRPWYRDGESNDYEFALQLTNVTFHNVLPETDDTYDLGSASLSWANLYLASTIHHKSDLSVLYNDSTESSVFRTNGEFETRHGLMSPFGGFGKIINAFTYSEDLSNAAWTKGPAVNDTVTVVANDTTAPDGTTTADKVTLANGTNSGTRILLRKNITTAANTAYVVSFWAKKVSGDFDAFSVDIGDLYFSSPGTINITTEWQRFVFYVTTTATDPNDWIDFNIHNHTVGVDDVLHMWGLQLSLDEAGPYTKTEANAANSSGSVPGAVVNNALFIASYGDGSDESEIAATRSLVLRAQDDGDILFYNDSTEMGRITTVGLEVDGIIALTETGTPPTHTAGKGYFWVENNAPNTPAYTDDAGNDYQLAYYFGAWAGEDSTGLVGYTSTTNIDFGSGRVEDIGPNGLSWDSVNDWLDLTDAGVYELSLSALFSKAAGSNTTITIIVDWWDGGAWNVIYSQGITVLASSSSAWSYTTLADVTAASGRIRVRTSATNAANMAVADMRVKRIE